MSTLKAWKNYKIIDAGNKEKLEQLDDILIVRSEPVALFNKEKPDLWHDVHAVFKVSAKNKGQWQIHKPLPQSIILKYGDWQFISTLGKFKHIGIFPEQAQNWDWMQNIIHESQRTHLKVLNLFAYTGGATVACASMVGVEEVVHVDAAKKMVQWAKDNVKLNNLTHQRVRFLVDDVMKFVEREIRRKRQYDIIILDPPSYGRGPNNQLWKIEDHLIPLLHKLKQLLSDQPLFLLLNSYSTHLSAMMIQNMMMDVFDQGSLQVNEIGIPISNSKKILPTGVTGKWTP